MSHDEQIAAVNRFQGLDRDAVFLVLGDLRIPGRFEEGRTKEEKMSAVHFLRFRCPQRRSGPAAIPVARRFSSSTTRTTRPEQVLGPSVRAELLRDLD